MLIAFLPVVAAATSDGDEPPDAVTIVKMVKSQFPEEQISISGKITVRRRRGAVVKEMGYSMNAKWTGEGGNMTCAFTDAFGRESSSVDLAFKHGGEPEFERKGDDLVDEQGKVTGTALDCRDLTMPFLWWKNIELVDAEKDRGRTCFVLEFRPEKPDGVSKVKAWIDSKIFIVLKAESYDKDEKLIKKVTVKSFKKLDEQWMIKDLEVISSSSPNKTVVTVEDMVVQKKEGGEEAVDGSIVKE